MTIMCVPSTEHYLVFTETVDPKSLERGNQIAWFLKAMHRNIYKIPDNLYFGRTKIPFFAGQWFRIGNGVWPKRAGWYNAKYKGSPILSLQIEWSMKDRKDYKTFLLQIIRTAAQAQFNEGKFPHPATKLDFSIRNRALEVQTEELNDRCEIVKTRDEAKRLSVKILGTKEEEPVTRWQHLVA
jgi:hypothetical protein